MVNKALSYSEDKKSGQITNSPLIQLNKLITDSEKNEQEGVSFMLMGFFQGARNIFQHNKVGSGVSDVLTIIIQASYFLNLLDGHSITKHGKYPYYGASGIIDFIDNYIFDEELVLLSEDGANIVDRNYRVAFIATGKYWVNNHAHCLRPKQGICKLFHIRSIRKH